MRSRSNSMAPPPSSTPGPRPARPPSHSPPGTPQHNSSIPQPLMPHHASHLSDPAVLAQFSLLNQQQQQHRQSSGATAAAAPPPVVPLMSAPSGKSGLWASPGVGSAAASPARHPDAGHAPAHASSDNRGLPSSWATPQAPQLPPRTKIICTLSSAESPERLKKMLLAGMNVARLNFSHGDHESHRASITALRDVCTDTRRICALLLDTKGPEIRTGRLFKDGASSIQLVRNQELLISTDESLLSDSRQIVIGFSALPKLVKAGNHILVDDGLIDLLVLEALPATGEVRCRCLTHGVLGPLKSVNLPGVALDLPAVTQKDVSDIRFGVEQGVDFIAASFVRRASDILTVRKILGARGAHVKIIAKIAAQEGLDNFESILAAADGIMIARGDLGVEVPLEQVALAQKQIIRACNLAGKFVITATQMLESMCVHPSPTRAEASDVANAVLDGTDCVMLSAETSSGRYPVETVQMMSDICREAEGSIDHRTAALSLREEQLRRASLAPTSGPGGGGISVTEAIASSSVRATCDLRAAVIIVLTETGTTARLVAKYRPNIPIITVTSSEQTARQSLVSRGLFPLLVGSMLGSDSLIPRVLHAATRLGMCKGGDLAVVTSGSREATAGATNDMKVVCVAT